jgi:Regulator of ribonuclease activity B
MAPAWLNRLLGKGKTKPPYDRDDLQVLDSYIGDENEGDRKVLAQMLQHKADLTRPRHAVFYLYFPNAESAWAASECLSQMDYDARTAAKSTVESENCWPVIAEKVCIVNAETMATERKVLNEVAKEFGGDFDGWEAALD